MQLERRRMVRRAFTGGVMLATAAMLPLSLLELGYALAFRHASVDSPGQAVRFGLYITLLLIWAGAMLGLLEGMLNLGIGLLTKFFAKRRVAEPRWMALIYSFLALPGIAMVTARIFSGRRASQIPGKDFIALGLGLMGLLAAYALFRLIIAARERFRLRRWGPREAMIISPALLLAAVLLYCADHGVLPRLYGWFHVGLFFLVVALLQLGVGACYVGFRPRTRWLSRAMEPGVSVLVLLAATAGGAWALVGIGASQPLRYLAFEHTAATAKILSGATALGLGRRRPPSPIPIAPAPKVRPEQPSLKKGPRAADSSVLLITVDALRADQLGAYGQERTISPRLDAWARSAVVFERGYCQVPHTSFSIASLMTGTYLHAERQVSPNRKHKTLAQALRHYGHKTAAFFPPAVFYIDREAFTPFERNRFGFEYVKYQYISAEGRVNQALDFLRKHKQQQAEKKKKKPKEKEQQIFIWVHFFEPHEPYEQKAGFEMGSGAMDRYRSEIAYVDHHVGRLIAQVRKELPRTIIALTADHGEEFGEHGGHYHGNALYEPQVRVPLVISAPGVAARKVHGAAQVIDLGPTILSLLDLSVPASMRGTDLGPCTLVHLFFILCFY